PQPFQNQAPQQQAQQQDAIQDRTALGDKVQQPLHGLLPCLRLLLLLLLLLLQSGGHQAGRLFIQQLHQILAARGHPVMRQQQRNGRQQAQYGGDQRLRNTRRHQFRIAGAKVGNGLEGGDHAGDGAQQPQQRRNASKQLDNGLSAFQRRQFVQYGLVHFRFQRIHIHRARQILINLQYAAQRIISSGLSNILLLPADSGGNAFQRNQPYRRNQQADKAQRDNDVTHQRALLNAFNQVRAFQRQG